jgi:hypothetical protein
MASETLGAALRKLKPVVRRGVSDGTFRCTASRAIFRRA